MSFRRTILYITGIFVALGFEQAQAGTTPTCQFEIEVNALRGGSPTVTVNQSKNITAKARIRKGTALSGTSISTTLQVEAVDGSQVIHTRTTSPIVLVVGKGGNGATFAMNIPQCVSGAIQFDAKFYGYDTNGALCEGTRSISKTCN
jgi:hypothetical protein